MLLLLNLLILFSKACQVFTEHNSSVNLRINLGEPVEVAFTCFEIPSNSQLVLAINSMLYFSKTTIHLHIIGDDLTTKTVRDLLRRKHRVSATFYSLPRRFKSRFISWIPNSHYSKHYGLIKLFLSEILPENLTKIVVLDTDVVFNADINDLWRLFSMFDNDQVLGLGENLSAYYQNRKMQVVGTKGVNTGVVLMHLQRMRSLGWRQMWKNATKSMIKQRMAISMADQDILNYMLVSCPQILFWIPCEWNMQWPIEVKKHYCAPVRQWMGNLKIAHFNNDRKFDQPMPLFMRHLVMRFEL